MGSALAAAVCKSVTPDLVAVSCRTPEHTASCAVRLGCVAETVSGIAGGSRFVFIGVKPAAVQSIASEYGTLIRDGSVIVSMAAGVSLERLEAGFGTGRKIVRIMPNTPVEIGKGVILATANSAVSNAEADEIRRLLSCAGLVDFVTESVLESAGTLTGCGPAFCYLFMQALADGAVAVGVPREAALRYAAATVAGSAELAIQTGRHPELLKDDVCSPGGTTIEGVRALKAGGMEAACMQAVIDAYNKGKKLL